MFKKKVKKTADEIKKEYEAKITATANEMRVQLVNLNKKKNIAFSKMMEARDKGLKTQEAEAKGLLKQAMSAVKRVEGTLMTLELAVETRDLAELNNNFLESMGKLSDNIIETCNLKSDKKTKQIGDKYLKALYVSDKQKQQIDEFISLGDYASVMNNTTDKSSEFDDEIDEMVSETETFSSISTAKNKGRN